MVRDICPFGMTMRRNETRKASWFAIVASRGPGC